MYYSPVLGLVAILLIISPAFQRQWRLSAVRLLHLSAGLIIAYGWMFLDNAGQIWHYFGLDFSTHTAVATVIVAYLTVHAALFRYGWAASLVAYFGFMLYKQYHSFTDIVTTAIVVIIPYALLLIYVRPGQTTPRTVVE